MARVPGPHARRRPTSWLPRLIRRAPRSSSTGAPLTRRCSGRGTSCGRRPGGRTQTWRRAVRRCRWGVGGGSGDGAGWRGGAGVRGGISGKGQGQARGGQGARWGGGCRGRAAGPTRRCSGHGTSCGRRPGGRPRTHHTHAPPPPRPPTGGAGQGARGRSQAHPACPVRPGGPRIGSGAGLAGGSTPLAGQGGGVRGGVRGGGSGGGGAAVLRCGQRS
jgi:hypothetical protein